MDESSTFKKLRPASTVIMARENEGELQIYLLKRSDRSKFMPGYYVFPGGTVDNEDKDPALWKGQVDGKEDVAYGVSAIRETFEEAGVFLAFRNEQTAGDLERICNGRIANGLSKGWLQELVVSKGWVLEVSRLKRWAHWITPALMPRRFDTRF
ncbi:MAG: NUDIX domain-containing protein, partial [Deltaproteobacteria bacterium]|nr:NUDIX domain-containing protein [Deltaproteobacteria bacterium]